MSLLPEGENGLVKVDVLLSCWKDEFGDDDVLSSFLEKFASHFNLHKKWILEEDAVKKLTGVKNSIKKTASEKKEDEKMLESTKKKKNLENVAMGIGKTKSVGTILSEMKESYMTQQELDDWDKKMTKDFKEVSNLLKVENLEVQLENTPMEEFPSILQKLDKKEIRNHRENLRLCDIRGMMVSVYQNLTGGSVSQAADFLGIGSEDRATKSKEVYGLLNQFPVMRYCSYPYSTLYVHRNEIRDYIDKSSHEEQEFWYMTQKKIEPEYSYLPTIERMRLD